MYNVSERPQVDDLPGGEPVIVAAAPAMLEVQSMARRAAVGESKVLITGESGVGKDLDRAHDPRAIAARRRPVRRRQLRRPDRDAARIGAVRTRQRQLHRRLSRQAGQAAAGAPRHALPRRSRRDEPAHAGAAAALSRDRRDPVRRRRTGASSVVNVRVVAATNRNLAERVSAGEFREDLLYRLRVIHIHVPPLRERREDVAAR